MNNFQINSIQFCTTLFLICFLWSYGQIGADYTRDSLSISNLYKKASSMADSDPIASKNILDTIHSLLDENLLKEYPRDSFLLSEKSKVLYFLSYYNRRNNKYDESLRMLQESLDLRKLLGQNQLVASNWRQIGLLWLYQQNFEKTEKSLDTALFYAEKYKNFKEKIQIYTLYGTLYGSAKGIGNKLEDYIKAEDYLQKAKTLADSLNSSSEIAVAYSNYALFLRRQKRYNENIPYLEKVAEIHKNENNLIGLESTLFALAVSYRNMGLSSKSITYYKEAIKLSKELDSKALIPFRYLGLSIAYKNLGDYKMAYETYVKYKESLEELNDINTIKRLSEQDNKYKYEKKRILDSIQFKNQENLKISKLEQTNRNRIFLIVLLSVVLLSITTILYLLIRQKALKAKNIAQQRQLENQKLQKEVSAKTSQVKDLLARVMVLLNKKEKLTENLKDIASENEATNLKKILLELKADKIEDKKFEVLKRDFETLNTEFINKIQSKFHQLTRTDIEIATLIKIGLSNEEIANLRNTSIDAVKKSRYRLKNKMDVPSQVSLTQFIRSL